MNRNDHTPATEAETTTPTTMRGVVQTGFGDPRQVLRVTHVPIPELPADGVRVAIRAASVHIGAVYGVRGEPRVTRSIYRKFIGEHGLIGSAFAGIVEAVGADVTEFAPGDEVFGDTVGAFAEHAVASQDALAAKPTNLSFEEAAALGVSAFTALQGLATHGGLREGEHVLVIGASGGVGSFAVQIATALGAEVTAVCSTRNVGAVRSIGADHVVDYTREDVTALAQRFDLVFDVVGNDSLRDLRGLLTDEGLLLSVGGPAPSGWFGGVGHPLQVGLAALFSRRQGRPFVASFDREDRRTLRGMAAAGLVTPVIDRILPLDEAVEAVASVGEGHNRGTTVISM